jgi:predicted Zn-dependent peptidase
VPRHRITELANGLTVATERMPGVRSVALGVFVGVGSRDETADVGGISHFIEHLLFRGSQRHTALEIAQIFDRFGAELNASTSREVTEVYVRVTDDHLTEALDVATGMVRSPVWADLEQERDVVLEEIAMYEDAPDDLVHDLIGEAVFPGVPLGRPIIGTAETIGGLDEAHVARHHAAYYRPSNMVIAAAGSVDHVRFVDLVEHGFGDQPDGQRPPRSLVDSEDGGRRAFLEKDTEQYHLCLGATGLSRRDPRRFACSLLDQILGGGASSRLFQEIRERRGMAYAVYSFASQFQETGSVGIYVGTRGENLEECLSVTRAELDELAAGRLEPDELERAKDAAKGRLALSLESTLARMGRLGRGLVTDAELLDHAQLRRRIDAVTPDQIAELAGSLFEPSALSVACIGPERAVFERAADATAVGAA